VPKKERKISDYLTTLPAVGGEVIPEAEEIFMRVVLPMDADSNHGILSTAIAKQSETSEILPVILDIDVFQVGEVAPTDSKISEVLENLRIYKNNLFEKSFTNLAKESFQ
jgi:uncharacterized protein (TIGR04255 family)